MERLSGATSPSPRVSCAGINAVFLEPRMGGVETYVRRLVPALLEARPALRVVIWVNQAGRAHLASEPWAGEVELVTHPLLGRRFLRAASELTLLGWLAGRRRVDVLHSVALVAPARSRAPGVVTIPDLTWIHHPDPAERYTAWLWRRVVPPVARRAERVITHSEASRRDIARTIRVPEERIDVVPHGPGFEAGVAAAEEADLRRRLDLGTGPIVLTVSAKKEHKNLARLVRAMARVRERHPDAVAVLPGNPTPHELELRRLAGELGIERNVSFPAYVDEADLEGLYRAARCFVFPSLREGFGLPVLEAMRRGVPVACSSVSAMPEVAGDAARYFDPTDVDDMAQAVLELLEDPKLAARLVAAGRERAREFTWSRAAEATLQSYDRAAARR